MTTAHYKYTKAEIDKIVKSMKIVIDTREKANEHVREYLAGKGVSFISRKLDTGDYSAVIPRNPELGIMRDIYLDACLERKNSIDEITGNLQKDTETAFENELRRSQDKSFVLVIEDAKGYEKILLGKYRSKYEPRALLGRLKAFEARYNFSIVYLDKKYMGNYIYHHLLYHAKEYLKNGVGIDFDVEGGDGNA